MYKREEIQKLYFSFNFLRTINLNILNNISCLVGLILILLSLIIFSEDSHHRSALTILPVLGSLLIISSNKSWINSKILSSSPMVSIGLVSYTWYLWHWPLLSIARNINGGSLPQFSICCLLLILGLLISVLSYLFIETPIRKKIISKPLTVSLVGCVVFCICIGVSVHTTSGFPGRLGHNVNQSEQIVNRFPLKNAYAEKNTTVLLNSIIVGQQTILNLKLP